MEDAKATVVAMSARNTIRMGVRIACPFRIQAPSGASVSYTRVRFRAAEKRPPPPSPEPGPVRFGGRLTNPKFLREEFLFALDRLGLNLPEGDTCEAIYEAHANMMGMVDAGAFCRAVVDY